MKQFSGFPIRMQFTAIPNLFFSHLLPEISDPAELKTTLYVFYRLYRKRGYPRFVTYQELLSDAGLMGSLREEGRLPDEVLRGALENAVKRGTVLHIILERDGVTEDVYLLNNESNSQIAARIKGGELQLPGLKAVGQDYIEFEKQPDLFALYEQNIGLLTPMVAEELREAEKRYPESWVRDAIKEAVSLNKRSWRYIERILERWLAEGRNDGTYQRDNKKTDPDKYIKGKYGRAVQR